MHDALDRTVGRTDGTDAQYSVLSTQYLIFNFQYCPDLITDL